LIAAGALFANTTDGFAIQSGGFLISSPNFYSKVDDSVTSGGNVGISVPLYAQVAASVYVIMPSYTVTVANTSGVVLAFAPWTKATAAISAQDKSDIRSGLALEATVSTKASQTSVNAIPTNPLLTNDARLNNLDATISTRATQTSVNAIPTNPLLTNDARLNNLDAAISSRLSTSGYTAPDNTSIVAIKTKTDTLVNGPTLAQIEGSTVLAKEATSEAIKAKTDTLVNGPTLAQIEGSTVLAKETTTTAIKAKTDSLTFTIAGMVDANIQYVNNDQVKGTGTPADPWNPV